jgi:hypothetical protein
MRKKIIQYLLLTIAISMATGCATSDGPARDPVQEVAFWSYTAASVGATYALSENPAARPYFESAVKALDGFIATTNVNPLALHEALSQLPIKELKSTEARLLITTATIVYQRYGNELTIDQTNYVGSVMRAVRDGLKLGLEQTPVAIPKPSASHRGAFENLAEATRQRRGVQPPPWTLYVKHKSRRAADHTAVTYRPGSCTAALRTKGTAAAMPYHAGGAA